MAGSSGAPGVDGAKDIVRVPLPALCAGDASCTVIVGCCRLAPAPGLTDRDAVGSGGWNASPESPKDCPFMESAPLFVPDVTGWNVICRSCVVFGASVNGTAGRVAWKLSPLTFMAL